MPIVTNGPILAAFKGVLDRARKPLAPDTEECSASVVRLLEQHQAAAQRPGMLLGKVQSGKTRAFVGALAIAFDSGFDVLVKTSAMSKPLVAQTIRRLRHDLGPALDEHRVLIFDAAARPAQLNEWQQQRKLIFVSKKHLRNLQNLDAMLLQTHPGLRNKRVLIVDDEADFASVGYAHGQGGVRVRRVQAQINALRAGLRNSVYLEVTATPYSLYLQPADITEPATGLNFESVRPAFTKRVPIHAGYIGGEVYFEEASRAGSTASYFHVPVDGAELAGMRQPGQVAEADLLTSDAIKSLRRSIITFVVGGVMRRLDELGVGGPERLFSFIIHLERLRGAHADQQGMARRLIEAMRTANLQQEPMATQIRAAVEDLGASRAAANREYQLTLPDRPVEQLLPEVGPAFASITVEVVNSDAQLEQLLDDTGQLRQQSPFNIYIGGQSLDRGVTIANVIGFFYGRDPITAQQDTTIQHCRMYGDRPKADLAVTRFYTSNGIYQRMRRMHEFDTMLWDQLRVREENGDQIDDPGDVVFLQRDPTGGVSPCSANKIILTRAQWTRPSGELVPRPFTTNTQDAAAPSMPVLLDCLQRLGPPGQPVRITVASAVDLLDRCAALINIDDGWDWDLDALKDAVKFMASRHPNGEMRDAVFALYTLHNDARKWKDAAMLDPQNAPYGAPTERPLRAAAGDSPMIALYHNDGRRERGWEDSPFVWPVVFVPDGVVPTVFANNRRRSPRRRRVR